MRQYKYFETTISGVLVNDERKQRTVVCKARSITEANRMLAVLELGNKIFKKNYYSELEPDDTAFKNGIEIADKDGVAFSIKGMHDLNFISIKDLPIQFVE